MMTLGNMRLVAILRLLTVFALLAISRAHAKYESANEMMPGCRDATSENNRTLFLQGLCVGAINALADTDNEVCLPPNSTLGQSLSVVINYIEARPERQHENFTLLAREALRQAWPCRR